MGCGKNLVEGQVCPFFPLVISVSGCALIAERVLAMVIANSSVRPAVFDAFLDVYRKEFLRQINEEVDLQKHGIFKAGIEDCFRNCQLLGCKKKN